ncbi:hypothetical protein [Anatilimnocola floriformis]|uniref:hypothetical protein n=1 Tax=Anatilimnocola floriformis TaxID=2948575 RepID=UPI0020C47AED|nr:hypothetical protein [Anatilimnocola floriformis]
MPENAGPAFSNAATDSRRINAALRELIRLTAQKVVKQIAQSQPHNKAKRVEERNR